MHNSKIEAQGYKVVTVTRRLWVRSSLEGMTYYLLIFSFLLSGQLSYATQHAMPKKFGGKIRTEFSVGESDSCLAGFFLNKLKQTFEYFKRGPLVLNIDN